MSQVRFTSTKDAKELETKLDQYVPIANNFNLRKESWHLILGKNPGYVHLILRLDMKFRTNIVCGKIYEIHRRI